MAKIALVIGIGVASALTGGLAAAGFGIFAGTFAGGSVLGGVLLGGSIGLSVGKFIGSLAFPGHSAYTGPRLADQTVSSSANGTPIPFGYGSFRLGGQIIWSGGIKETKTTQTQSAKGGPSQTSTTYTYTISFAAAFCEGPAGITRIWGDSKIIYDATSKGAITNDKLSTGIGNNTVILTPRIYPGNSTQLPDPTIQAAQGVNATSANRDLCYILYEDFPLFDFGNRLPNIRAELTVGTDDAFLKDIYPPTSVVDPYAGVGPNTYPPQFTYIDQTNRVAIVFDQIGMVAQRIDLIANNRVPVNRWAAATRYFTGDQILDSNGNIQGQLQGGTGGALSDTTEPTWTTIEGDTTADAHSLVWANIGPGPEAIPVTAQAVLNFKTSPGDSFQGNDVNHGCAQGVDTLGNVWNQVVIQVGLNTSYYAVRYDPRSFTVTGRIKLVAPILTMQFFKNNAGTNIVAWTDATNVTGGSKINFYDAHTLSKLCEPTLWAVDSMIEQGNGQFCFDNDGVAYIVGYRALTPFEFFVNRVDPRSGGSAGTKNFTFTAPDAARQPMSVLWSPVDNSLICVTVGGYVMKIDVATMAVVATTATAILGTTGGAYFGTQSSMWPSGQVSTIGKLFMFSNTPTQAFLTINPETLAIEKSTPMSSFFPTGTPGGVLFHSYDVATNSLILTITSSTWSGFTYRIFLERQAVNASPLDGVVADILERSGMLSGDIDVTALAGIEVLGYPVARNADVKSIVSPLTQAFFFDLVESDFKVKAVLRGGAPALSVPEADLGLDVDKFEVVTTYAQENDLPKTLQVLYADPTIDYQVGKQSYERNARVVKTRNIAVVEIPITLDPDAAAQIAFKAMRAIWDERNSYDLKLWRAKYLRLDPADTFQFTYGGTGYAARLTKTSVGQSLVIEVNAVSEDPRNYVSELAGATSDGFVPGTLSPLGPSLLFLLDLPLLQDIDASPVGSSGYYYIISAVGKGWPGAVLYKSVDNTRFDNVGFSKDESPFGYASDPLPPPRSPWVWDDENTLTVRMVQGSLSSTTDINVLNGANAAIYGGEVLQYGTATLNGDGSYTLSHLLRGRRGTEDSCYAHIPGEYFISLDDGVHRNIAPTSDVGITNYYKAVTVGGIITGAQSQTIALTGADLKPYAPAQVGGVRDIPGNFSLSWVRRTRIGGAWLDGTGEVPLNEAFESYDLEIMRLDFHGKPVPQYSISPSTPCYYDLGLESSGMAEVTVAYPRVKPFTATYKGQTINYLGDKSLFVGHALNFDTPYYAVVYDPGHIGETPGNLLVYAYTTDDSFANDPDYVFAGIILPHDGPPVGGIAGLPGGSDAVVRSVLNLQNPSYFYTAANVLADFFTQKKFLRVRVYQNSAAVGRGFVADEYTVGRGLPPVGGSYDAASINGMAVLGIPLVDGEVLTYVAANGDLEWKLPPGTVARAVKSLTTGSLANNAAETGSWDLGAKTILVLKATSDRKCRVQLYSTAAAMSADSGRPIGTPPTAGSENEVILDLVLDSDVSFAWIASPAVPGSNVESSPTTSFSYRITNLSGSTSTVAVTATVLPLES